MTSEIAAAQRPLTPAPGRRATGGMAGGPVQVGYGVSLTDFGGFQQSMANAGRAPGGATDVRAERSRPKR